MAGAKGKGTHTNNGDYFCLGGPKGSPNIKTSPKSPRRQEQSRCLQLFSNQGSCRSGSRILAV